MSFQKHCTNHLQSKRSSELLYTQVCLPWQVPGLGHIWSCTKHLLRHLVHPKSSSKSGPIKNIHKWTSLVVQWIRIHLPTWGTGVQPLIQENSTCHRTTKPVCHYWAHMLKLLKPTDLESVLRNKRSHRKEKPAHSPHSLQLEKARTQLQTPKATKTKQTNLLKAGYKKKKKYIYPRVYLVHAKWYWMAPNIKDFWHGPNVSMDILERSKYQGCFGMDQMS